MRKHGISTQYNVKCPVLSGLRDSDKKNRRLFLGAPGAMDGIKHRKYDLNC